MDLRPGVSLVPLYVTGRGCGCKHGEQGLARGIGCYGEEDGAVADAVASWETGAGVRPDTVTGSAQVNRC